MKTETFKLSDNILRNWGFFVLKRSVMYRSLTASVTELHGNDLKVKFVSNTKRKIAPGDILSLRLTP